MIVNRRDLKILGIAGSLRACSSSQLALEYAMNLLSKAGCHTREFDLRTAYLPFCNGEPDEQARDSMRVAELRQAVYEAHALVLVTPEYHGGISGVLKNALDLLDKRQLTGKVVGLVSVLGGGTNGYALNDLSRIMRCCHAWVLPQQIAISHAGTVFANGQLADLNLQIRFKEFTDSLVQSAMRLYGSDSEAIYNHEPDTALQLSQAPIQSPSRRH